MSDRNAGLGHEPSGAMDGTEEPAALGAAPTLPLGKAPKKDRSASPNGTPGRTRKRRLPRLGLGVGSLLIVVAVLVLAAVPLFNTGLKKTPRDKVGISYGGGPIEGSRYQRVVQPGSSLFFNGLFDPLYQYPADQQNYIISKAEGEGAVKRADSVAAPTSDRVQVDYQVATFFKLNIDRLRAFHEQLGLKYDAYTDAGWSNLLRDTFRQQIESALQQATRRYTVNDLVGSAEVLIKIQTEVQQNISDQLIQALGQQFFCGPSYVPGGECGPITFVIKKIDIPSAVQNAYNSIQQRTNEAKAIEILAEALENAGKDYVLLKAVESGAVKFWVIPEGADVTLQGPDSTDGETPAPPTTGP